ncbi:MAG: tetratricopeptide repeat protein [Candidatus Sumerlaeaceae bacterium]|nr:tetratricopeptide repeat protein [Candidatus Sumerlaeaceae bacterium]
MTNGREWFITAAIFLVGVLSYLPALRGGFVWDDTSVTDNVLLRSPAGLWAIWFQPSLNSWEDHYWPVVYSTFWLEHALWGLEPLGYHLVNVLIHSANAVILYQICRRLKIPGAAFAAALFAVHPVHVESVAWIIERKDVLSACFYGLAYLCYLEFDQTGDRRPYFLGLVLFLLALLSKSIVVTFPFALLLAIFWQRGSVSRQDIVRVLPYVGLSLVVSLADFAFMRGKGGDPIGLAVTDRILIASRAYFFYLKQIVWPYPLLAIHPRWQITPTQFAQWLVPFAAFLSLMLPAILFKRAGRGPVAAIWFFAITVAPILGLVEFSYQRFSFVADRYQYLASAGPIVLLAGILVNLANRNFAASPGIQWAGAALFLALPGAATWNYAMKYKDTMTLFEHTLRYNPGAWEAHNQIGVIMAREGRLDDAMERFRKALSVKPDYAEAHCNLGLALLSKGDAGEAEAELRRALQLMPNYAEAQNGLGVLLAQAGRKKEAAEHFTRALELQPFFEEAQENLNLLKESLPAVRK